jgi:hypothetical protein
MLVKAIGYTGDARYVAFNWTPYGDEAEYFDGRRSATGSWQVSSPISNTRPLAVGVREHKAPCVRTVPISAHA